MYYVSELIQDAKRNVIRQNCSLLLCFGSQKKRARKKESYTRSRGGEFGDCVTWEEIRRNVAGGEGGVNFKSLFMSIVLDKGIPRKLT